MKQAYFSKYIVTITFEFILNLIFLEGNAQLFAQFIEG